MTSEQPAYRAVVLVSSNRAAAGIYPDRTGPIIVAELRDHRLTVGEPRVVADGAPFGEALAAALAEGPDLILTTGGTGLTSTDEVPERTLALLDRLVPGIPEAIRALGVATGVKRAILSRGVAGIAGRTLVVNLPGSTGGVRDALAVLRPILTHALEQLHDGDH